MTLAACPGVLAGRHIENGQLGIAYVGAQFAPAFLVVLAPYSDAHLDIAPGIERLSGLLLGMVLLEPARLVFKVEKADRPRYSSKPIMMMPATRNLKLKRRRPIKVSRANFLSKKSPRLRAGADS